MIKLEEKIKELRNASTRTPIPTTSLPSSNANPLKSSDKAVISSSPTPLCSSPTPHTSFRTPLTSSPSLLVMDEETIQKEIAQLQTESKVYFLYTIIFFYSMLLRRKFH